MFHCFVGFVLFFNWSSNAWNRIPDKTYEVKVVSGPRHSSNRQQRPAALMNIGAPRQYTAVEPVPVKPGHVAEKFDSLTMAPPGVDYGDGGAGAGTGTGPGGYMPPPPEQAQEFYAFDEAPVLLRAVNPAYPDLARQAGIEGTVLLNVLVDENGKVLEVSVIQSDVTSAMEKAAEEAAMHFFFKPAKQRTVPVRAHVAVPIRFKLH
ncbi:MAG TPA: energy transducer TonB [Candidatus Bathyarchaeia archaeon]|nr:energy transducer TonB [Candidatus Bathyarchaeia archaeon]